MLSVSYHEARVDFEAGARAIELMKERSGNLGPEVLLGIGAFGGLFDLSALKGMDRPVLVASTDGVGTKTKIASALDRFDRSALTSSTTASTTSWCRASIRCFSWTTSLAAGSTPKRLQRRQSCAAACLAAGYALLGGKTAEMPGIYAPGEFDLVGAIVGVVDRAFIDGSSIVPGGQVIGLASAGLHTNGFSLARRVLQGWDLHATPAWLGRPLGEALLAPHRCTWPRYSACSGWPDHQRLGPHHRRWADRQPAAHST